ncbi:hypothetical protein FOYG_17014 [Fusarium oxysporum NRRL 32931]|uniref:Uncharacterized protein n=1 Tax=Fusarium oxysporum NRRL 32931 TaxID=660029 RepID=W9HC81_FUSOX|nr:hypothetical protein FOYG_17014 [Fusarium oxysporum NRRL 32931]
MTIIYNNDASRLIAVYAATEKGISENPGTGMWKELCADFDIPEDDVDMENLFIGDAVGRTASLGKVWMGLRDGRRLQLLGQELRTQRGHQYQTPEKYFLGAKPRSFAWDLDISDYPFPEPSNSGESGIVGKTNDKEGYGLILWATWAWFSVPETSGRSLESMDHLFELPWYKIGLYSNKDAKEKDQARDEKQRMAEENDAHRVEIKNKSQQVV